MAKAEPEKINKSEIIREAIKDSKWDGDNIGLAKFLEEKYPGHTFTATAIGSIRSKSKSEPWAGAAAKILAAKGSSVSMVKAAVPMAEASESPFMDQLKQLKELIGSEGVKKLVEGL